MKALRTAFLFICAILIVFNVYQLTKTLFPERPVGFAGFKFSGLENILKNEPRIGYITDLNLKEAAPLAEYEQAQYILAPAILEINNPSLRLFIVNCSSDTVALRMLKDINAQPLTRNNFGVILAMRNETTSKNNLSTETISP